MKALNAKNPLTMGTVSLTDLSAWLGGILFVVMFGIIVAAGTKVLNVLDNKLPGNQTPGMAPYKQPITGSGIEIL